jgi:DNA-binding transcriptional MerR regulator
MDLMGIGEFARVSRLSPKALRLYDELGLLPPARVDVDSGYRWYAAGQLDQARLVASLRQIGVPLAQIKVILGLDAQAAAEQVADYWTGAEIEHAARRQLVGYLVDRLNGKRSAMYEVAVRDIPARSLLTMLRHVHADEQIPVGREFLIGRMRGGSVPSPVGIAGAPFVIYHGEVTEDSDGPVEWCWPVPDDQAAAIAARFPDLTLRTEPGHQEAFIHLEQERPDGAAQWQVAGDALFGWVLDQHRKPNGGARMILIPGTGDPSAGRGPDFDLAIALR